MAEAPKDDLAITMEGYSTQYLKFTPKSFCNGVYNAMNEYLSVCIKAVQVFITNEYSGILTADQVANGIGKIVLQYSEVFDKTFDRFETYICKNILNIPSNVLLPEDLPQATLFTQEDEEQIDDEIEELKMKIWAVKAANAKLRDDLVDMDFTQKELDATLTKLDELQNLMAKAGVTDPHEYLQTTAENIQKGRQLIQRLTKDAPRMDLGPESLIAEEVGSSRK